MGFFTREEKKVIAVLSTGTALEYTDFYLFVHLATTLNLLFFAITDAKSQALLMAFGYSATYLFRPLGALILGYIGDRYGRKKVINITLSLMGVSCLGIFFLPTYAQIGLWASVFLVMLRILQSVSTMGEILGGEIYLTEFMKGRQTFVSFGILDMMASVGAQIALFGISLSFAGYFDFRYLFLMGLVIFLVGYQARKTLTESSEYVEAEKPDDVGFLASAKTSLRTIKELFSNVDYRAALCIDSMGTAAFFLSVTGLSSILRNQFAYDEAAIANHNMKFGSFILVYAVIGILYAVKFNPMKMVKIRSLLSIITIALIPFFLNNYMSVATITYLQVALAFLSVGDIHIGAVVLRNIPTNIRFRIGTLSFAVGRAFVAGITSFGLVLVEPYLGNYMYAVFGLPFAIGFYWAVRHFEKLDRANSKGLLQHYES